MPIFAYRLSRFLRVRLTGWRLPLAIALAVFVTSWAAMVAAEPASNEITRPSNYWWYFLVTAATVGYGDFFPVSTAGHLVGVYVIVGGIVTLTLLFLQLAERLSAARGRRMKGALALDLHDHVVLLGHAPGRTERLLKELTAEGQLQVVLCAWDDLPEHPLPDAASVHFVRGDLTHTDVMVRACVARARTAVIDGRDDNETLAIAVAVDHANPDIHMVAALRDLGRREHLSYVNPHVQGVQWHMPSLLVVPDGFPQRTVGDAQTFLGRTFGATLLAVRTRGELTVSPPWDRPVEPGATLYYVAKQRLDATRLAAR